MADREDRAGLASASSASLCVWLLGGLCVEWAGQPVAAFESDKARGLFCYLLVEARPVRRQQLAGLFWSEQPEARARGNLSRVLSNLRALLPGCLASDRATVALAAELPAWVDARELSSAYQAVRRSPDDAVAHAVLDAALEHYRGPFLAGFSLAGCPEFEEWLRVQQEQWHDLALRALDLQAAYFRQRGEWAAAVGCARRALALDPWRESAHRQLMLLLAMQGEREQALRQYETCRRILADELGVAPDAETEALYRRLVAAESVDELGETPFPAPAAALSTISLPLVGRETAHAWLLARWEAARRGAGGLTLVTGEAGIGKTRLVRQVLGFIARQGTPVFSGRCYEFNRALPYQAIHEALRPAIGQDPPAQGTPLAHLLYPDSAAPAERAALFEAVSAWLRGPWDKRSPRALFLDDLHWADADTLDLLHYLVRNLGEAPCWIVGTYRPAEIPPAHPLTRLAQALNHEGLLHTLALGPLSAMDVDCLADAPLAAYLYRESEGNPFFLAELIETLREQGLVRATGRGWELSGDLDPPPPLPARVQDVILQRVQRLDETSQYLLHLAAAHGRPFDAALLAAAGECAPGVVESALADWRARQLARPAAAGWDLAHDRIRAALYQSVPVPLRRLLHARLGAALAELEPAAAALLAYHCDRAQQPEAAARYLLVAGDQARQAYAQEQALAAYRRGLELASAPELRYTLLGGLETVCDMASRRDEQRAALAEMAALIEGGPPGLNGPHYRVQVALRQAHYAEATSDYAAAAAAAERAVAIAQTVGDDLLLAAGFRQWGYALRRQEGLPAARELYERARAAAERTGARAVLADSLQGLANVAWNMGDYATAQAYLEQSLALCRELGDRRGEADAYNILGIVWQRQGDYAWARDNYHRALDLRCAIGDRRGQGVSHNNLGAVAYDLGDLVAAEAAYVTAMALCVEAEDRWGAAIAALGLGGVALDRGDLDAAQQHVTSGLTGLQQVGARQRMGQAEYMLGRVAQARGDWDAALGHFAQATVLWRSSEQWGGLALGSSALAQLWAEEGDAGRARPYLEEALSFLDRAPLPAGIVRPLAAYLHTCKALRALGDPRSEAVAERAQSLLRAQAARLPEAEADRFLRLVAEHRDLAALT